MDELKLFHGSPALVSKPEQTACRPNNDYGAGFYCASSMDLAKEWACKSLTKNGFVNEYTLPLEGLRHIDLDGSEYSVLNWIAVLMANRRVSFKGSVEQKTVESFIRAYNVDLSSADIVSGFRADDSYFSIARAFVTGLIGAEDLERMLKLGGLGRQTMLKSSKAFDSVRFVKATPVPAATWYKLRQERMDAANSEFKRILQQGSIRGKTFTDIAKEL